MTKKIIKLPDVMEVTALSRSSIYAFINEGTFPKPIPLGARGVGWINDEISEWIDQKIESREV